MLLIDCPHCGRRAQSEFVYDRTLDGVVPLAMAPHDAVRTLYTRANLRGWSDELWHHRFGCRQWLVIRRHTATHAIESVRGFT
jgi:heterotetrameric sarcosine oxidase delta subunit